MKKRSIKLTSLVIAVIILSISLTVGVCAAYPKHSDFISDKAVILDEATEENVIKASDKLFDKKNVRIAVCTVLDTDGESIQTFGSNLFRKWKIGDGVLILLSINDDNFYAVQSNSLSEYLPEKDLKNILSTNLEPAFAEKDYSEGVHKTVNAIANHLSNTVPADFGEDKGSGLPGWAVAIIVILIIIAVIVGGGFGVIIFLRKKNARRRREEMELRRRRLAEGRGRDMRRNPATYPPRIPGQQGIPGARPQNSGITRNGAYPTGQRRPQQNGSRPQSAQGAPRPQNAQQSSRIQDGTEQLQRTNAATIQINTSDIRAAKQNRRP